MSLSTWEESKSDNPLNPSNRYQRGLMVLNSAELQVKSLSDQETKIKLQKKQLQARQALAKAQEKMRDIVKPVA